MINEETVRQTLENLVTQRERLKQELWATEGAIAVCVSLLEGGGSGGRVEGIGEARETRPNDGADAE